MTRKITSSLTCILVSAICAAAGYARDIDVDAIYLSKESPLYRSLSEKKLGVYQDINSTMIDSGVIHALWSSGDEIVYVRETGAINIIYLYDRKVHRKRELARIDGTVTCAYITQSGRYLYLKQLIVSRSAEPVSRRVIVATATGRKTAVASPYPFTDFSVVPGGDSIIYHAGSGVVEYDPDLGTAKTILDAGAYSSIIRPDGVTIPYFSPNRKKLLIISGSGGDYSSAVFFQGKKSVVSGISSAAEIFWLDNETIMYRAGYMGDYGVNILNVRTGQTESIARGSLNTNIRYSPLPKIASLLINQVLHIYDHRSGRMMNCGIEGEDASFSPDGIRFISLLSGKLLMTSLDALKDNGQLLKKNAKTIAGLYGEAEKNSRYWNNEFTRDYLRKKILVYSKL